MVTAKEQLAALIAKATKGARIDILRRQNADEGFTCHSVGIGGGCGEDCPVYLAHDCEHNKPNED
jgi:hypothetical protein